MVYVRSQQGLQQYLAPEVITTFSCFYTGDGHFSQKRCEKKTFLVYRAGSAESVDSFLPWSVCTYKEGILNGARHTVHFYLLHIAQ
jgi:hypothetical protein